MHVFYQNIYNIIFLFYVSLSYTEQRRVDGEMPNDLTTKNKILQK